MIKQKIDTGKTIFKLGTPIVIGQLGVLILGFSNSAMVGYYSTDAIAASAFVNNIFHLSIMLSLGFSYGLTPIVSENYAKRMNSKIGESVKSALILNIGWSLILMLLMTIVYFNIEHLGQPASLIPIIKPYYIITLFSLIFIAIFNTLLQLSDGIGDVALPMWILLFGSGLNILLNYILIYGTSISPPLGLVGAGISTFFVRLLMTLVMICILLRSKRYKQFLAGFQRGILSLSNFKYIFRRSMPMSLQVGLENVYFVICAIMVGWLGVVQLASYQIVCMIAQCCFVIYYSFAVSMVIVGSRLYGVNNLKRIKITLTTTRQVVMTIVILIGILLLFVGRDIIMLFTDSEQVIALSMTLLPALILYIVCDALQTVYANALRIVSQETKLAIIAIVCYICIGTPLAYLSAFTFKFDVVGVFYSFSIALILASFLYRKYFLKVINK